MVAVVVEVVEEEECQPEMLLEVVEVVEQVTHKVEEAKMFSRICHGRRPRPSLLLGIRHLKSGKMKWIPENRSRCRSQSHGCQLCIVTRRLNEGSIKTKFVKFRT